MRRLGHTKRDANMRVDSYIEGWKSKNLIFFKNQNVFMWNCQFFSIYLSIWDKCEQFSNVLASILDFKTYKTFQDYIEMKNVSQKWQRFH